MAVLKLFGGQHIQCIERINIGFNPTDEQVARLNQSFAALSWVYNAALAQRNTYGCKQGSDPFERDSSFTAPRQSKELHYRIKDEIVGLCDDNKLKWVTEIPKDYLDAALRDLDKAFQRFFVNFKKGHIRRMSVVSVLRPQQLSVIQGVQSEKIYGVPVARPMVVFGQDYVTLPKLGRFRYQRH